MAYSAIDIGPGATDRPASSSNGSTLINTGNPANANGILNSFEFYFALGVGYASGVKAGTFSGSGTSYASRDYENIGTVNSGSKQTFTGKNCDVSSGDFIGVYWTGPDGLESTASGAIGNRYSKSGDQFGSGSQTYTFFTSSRDNSLYATGITIPDAPTNVSATDNLSDKVTITWTAGTGETGGHRVYRDGVDISGVVAHGTTTYYDTTAVAGTTYSYTVKAINDAGLSAASTADNGIVITPKIIIF